MNINPIKNFKLMNIAYFSSTLGTRKNSQSHFQKKKLEPLM